MLHAVGRTPEKELEYWQMRVFRLETIVCDLLTKNEVLRGKLVTVGPNAITKEGTGFATSGVTQS